MRKEEENEAVVKSEVFETRLNWTPCLYWIGSESKYLCCCVAALAGRRGVPQAAGYHPRTMGRVACSIGRWLPCERFAFPSQAPRTKAVRNAAGYDEAGRAPPEQQFSF